jgi:hypothetical protein
VVANKKSGSHRSKEKLTAGEKKSAAKSRATGQLSDVVTIDRRESRERRGTGDRRTDSLPPGQDRRVVQRRAKVNRRRQIDPTTCERDYTPDEIEFMSAMDQYKRRNGRMFPTCSEVLEVLKELGYAKHTSPEAMPLPSIELAVTTSPSAMVVG